VSAKTTKVTPGIFFTFHGRNKKKNTEKLVVVEALSLSNYYKVSFKLLIVPHFIISLMSLDRSEIFLNYVESFNKRIEALHRAEEYFRQSSIIEAVSIPTNKLGKFLDRKIEEFNNTITQIDRDFLDGLNPDLAHREDYSSARKEIRREFGVQRAELFGLIYRVIDDMIEKRSKIDKNYHEDLAAIELKFMDGKIDQTEYINTILGDF